MAKLYKMTMYVCDLEEDLSLETIKTLVEDNALNGCAVNCICHFDFEQTGPRIDFNDEMDINMIDCPTYAWESYFH